MRFLENKVTGYVNNQNMNNDTGSPKTKNLGINQALATALNTNYQGMLIDGLFFSTDSKPYAGVDGTKDPYSYNAYQCTLAESADANRYLYVASNTVNRENPYSSVIPDELSKYLTVEDELFRALAVDIDDVLEVTRSIVDAATPADIDPLADAWYTLTKGKLTYTTTEPTSGYAFRITGKNKYTHLNQVRYFNISDQVVASMDLIQIVRVL